MGLSCYGDGRYYIVVFKDHVNLGFTLKGLTKRDADLLDGGGKIMKHLKILTPEAIEKERIIRLLNLVEKRKSNAQT